VSHQHSAVCAATTRLSTLREFLAKLLIILLGLQCSVVRAQEKPRSAATSPVTPAQSAKPAASLPAGAPALKNARSAWAVGAHPKYLPIAPEDPLDPYIVKQAALLGNKDDQIFAFVRDHIAFEAYRDSVRGARGTLWAMAGNTLDKASLLIALLGASGYTAQYEHANIYGTPFQNTLVMGMFPTAGTYVGCVPTTAGTQDPRQNPDAIQVSSDYYWVQYGKNGANTTALDPNVPGAAAGQSFQTADSTFATVPTNLRQQVTVKIDAELYNQAGSLFGQGPGITHVFSQKFDASSLVGSILTVGNLVNTSGGGALDFSATTFTYTPFVLVGSGGADVSQDTLITGTPYQELYTNFPLSSQILTGLFLEVDADDYTYTSPNGGWTHTLFDRLGPAGRQGNASVNLSLSSPPAPALTQFDLTSVNINTARQPQSSIQDQQTRLSNAYHNYENIKTQVSALPASGPLNDAQSQLVQQAVNLGEYLTVAENELITMGYNYTADVIAQQLQTGYYSRVYPNSPRITIAASAYNDGNSQEMLDVLKNDMLVIGGLGQNTNAKYWEELMRGMLESLSETTVLNQATGQTNAVGIGEVFAALGDPSQLTVVGPQYGQTVSNPQALSATTLSADAQTLIQNDVAAGNVVMTPNKMLTVNGVTTVGWWETNPTTGHTISHFVNGGHQAIMEAVAVDVANSLITGKITEFIGRVEGFGVAGIVFATDVLQGVVAGNLKVTKQLLGNPPALGSGDLAEPPQTTPQKQFFDFMAGQLLQLGVSSAKAITANSAGAQFGLNVYGLASSVQTYEQSLAGGYYDGLKWLAANLPADPDVLEFVSTPLGLPAPTLHPGTTAGVQIGTLAVDPLYTMQVNGNSLPLVFDLPITNTGPSTDTFSIQTFGTSAFQVYPTLPSLTLQGGQTGMVNVCVVPRDPTSVPVVGQAQPYSITVTSNTNPAITSTASPTFNTPPMPSLEISTDPPALAAVPGGGVPFTLTFASVGNLALGTVSLKANVPAGLTLTGLPSSTNVPLNATTTQSLTISAASNLPSGGYNLMISATYTPTGGTPQFINISIPVNVTALGACAVSAAALASKLSKPTLAIDLAALESDLDSAAAAPSNASLATRVVADMNLIVNQELTASYFQSIVPNLTSLTNAVAAANASTLPAALANLSNGICAIATLLTQVSTTNARLSLSPSTALSQANLAVGPNSTAQWNLIIANYSSVLHVYDLSITGLPSGVTAQFSQPTVTLAPNGSTLVPSLTLTTGATFNTPFSFNVVATPEDAPEFPITASATLLARPESVSVDQVTATPSFVNAGAPITFSARIFSVVNEQETGTLKLFITDPTGHGICCGLNADFTLTPSTSVQTITFAPFDTTSLSNGVYKYSVTAYYGGTQLSTAATGAFLIGAPLSGTLTANPSVVGPGSSTVQATLTINRDTIQNPISTLVGSANVNGVPRAMTLFQNGAQQLAYVCSDSVVNIVDVTDPTQPKLLANSFAGDILTTESGNPGDPQNGVVPGFQVMSCNTYSAGGNHYFLISYSRFDGNTTGQTIPTHFASYSLTDPIHPAIVGSVVDLQRPDSAGLYLTGNTALMYQSTTFYYFGGGITGFTGDVWAADLSKIPTNGAISYLNDLYPCGSATSPCPNLTNVPNYSGTPGSCTQTAPTQTPNDISRGGPYKINGGTAVNSTTSYFASSNANGGLVKDPNCPQIVGELLVVDTTDPSHPSIVSTVTDPAMAFVTGIAVQGNTAVVVGDSLGFTDINSGLVGNLVISSFDITNPRNPVLLNSVTTQLTDVPGSFIVPLGSNAFAVGNTTLNKKAELVLVDATNPNALRYVPYDANFVANPTIAQNPYFFALSATPDSAINALSIFQLAQVAGPQLTVSLQIPSTGNAALVPSSFNLAPTTTTPGTAFTTYTWNQPTTNTITFNMALSNVNPGDATTLINSGQMNFTLPTLGSGTFTLAPLSVLTQHTLTISPTTQSVNFGGQTATYTATITNPLPTPQTFIPTVIVPPGWTSATPASVAVPANGSQSFNVTITPPINGQYGGYTFNVIAATTGGTTDSVPAILGVGNNGTDLGGNGNTTFAAFTSSISPSQVTVGQGNSSSPYTITSTNVGNVADDFNAGSPANGPSGIGLGSYSPSYSVHLSPNLSGSVNGTILVQRNTTPGTYPVTIPINDDYGKTQNVNLNVRVSSAGIFGYVSPNPGTTSDTFTLYLSNYGLSQDTFNLSIVGPFAQTVSIQPTVTLGAGASNPSIPITFNSTSYIVPADTKLQILAVSQNDPAVQALFTATVTVKNSQSVTAAILPGTATASSNNATIGLLFNATNTGNVSDNYTATILGTTGPVSGSFASGGPPVTSIANFYAPARGTAQFPLYATVSGPGTSTVTVRVTSLSTPSVSSNGTVTISGNGQAFPTAAVSSGGNTPVNRLALLDGSSSHDNNSTPLSLTYAWTVLSVPAGSTVTNASINLANAAVAAFRPDVLGAYTLKLTVSNTAGSSIALVNYTAIDAPPVAVPASDFNAAVGAYVHLNGSNSYDPDGQPISYAWALVSAPAGSALTTTSFYNSQTPNAFFQPDVAGVYQFQLIVTDPTASSTPATVNVTAAPNGSIPPNAIAGPNQNVALHSTVTLSSAGSVDPNSAPLALAYQWTFGTQPAGSTATLSNANTASAQFTPDLPGPYVVKLVVSNAHGTSAIATTTVYAYSGDAPPNATAGANQFVTPTSTVTLNSQGSADPDSGPLNLSFLWWLNSLPFGSTASLTHPTTPTPTFVADKSGYFTSRLEANDGLLAGFANTMVTSAATCDVDANGVINSVDIALIRASFGQSAPANDPRDYDHNGTVNENDANNCNALVGTGPPALQVQPSSLSQAVMVGSNPLLQTVQVTSNSNPISYTVTSDQPWLTSNVSSDNTNSISTLVATLNPGGLTASPTPYAGNLTFTPNAGATVKVPVSLTVTAPALQVSPTAFSENLVQGGAAVSQSLQVSSTGSAINFNVTSDSAWLTTSIASGSTTAVSSLNAIITPGSMTPNTYTGKLTFNPGNVVVTVTLTITAPAPVTPSPTTLTFNANYGGSTTTSQPVSVTATGATAFTVTSDSSWLSAGVPNGVTPATLNVTASPGTMVPGAYTGHLTLTSGSNTSTITVTFNVAAVQSPCDVNTDGLINVRDIQKLVNETLGTQSTLNDLTSDGAVNVVDIQIDANAVLQRGCKAH
jgi:hypothetical protein